MESKSLKKYKKLETIISREKPTFNLKVIRKVKDKIHTWLSIIFSLLVNFWYSTKMSFWLTILFFKIHIRKTINIRSHLHNFLALNITFSSKNYLQILSPTVKLMSFFIPTIINKSLNFINTGKCSINIHCILLQ